MNWSRLRFLPFPSPFDRVVVGSFIVPAWYILFGIPHAQTFPPFPDTVSDHNI